MASSRRPQRLDPQDFGIGHLFKVVRDGVVVADAASERIVLWNDSAAEIFGYSEKEALELPLHALVPEALRDMHRNGLARYQETGSGELIDSGKAVELPALRKDGSETPIELTLTAIPEVGPRGERFALAIVRDIADRKAAEAAALEKRDIETRRQQALELNDAIVQGLAVTKMSLESGRTEQGMEALARTLEKARTIVSDLLDDLDRTEGIHPGSLIHGDPAELTDQD